VAAAVAAAAARRAEGKAAVKRALSGALAAPADPFASMEDEGEGGGRAREPGAGWRVRWS